MLRKILGAVLALGISATAAMAVPVFDGTISLVPGPGDNCLIVGSSYPAIYRPQIGGVGTKSGIVISTYRSGVGFLRADNGQFSGVGSIALFYVTADATLVNRVGSFNVTQVPANVVAGTQTITMTSAVFTPTVGCQLRFKASFLRRAGT